jgi:hypothetical protein
MQTAIVQDRQTLFDIAIQYCGDREAVFAIADLNDLSITETLPAGSEVIIPNIINQKVVVFYRTNSIVPATATDTNTEIGNNTKNSIGTNNGSQMVTNNDINILIVVNNGQI